MNLHHWISVNALYFFLFNLLIQLILNQLQYHTPFLFLVYYGLLFIWTNHFLPVKVKTVFSSSLKFVEFVLSPWLALGGEISVTADGSRTITSLLNMAFISLVDIIMERIFEWECRSLWYLGHWWWWHQWWSCMSPMSWGRVWRCRRVLVWWRWSWNHLQLFLLSRFIQKLRCEIQIHFWFEHGGDGSWLSYFQRVLSRRK